MFDLNPQPYEAFLEKISDGTHLDNPRLALNLEVGKRILEVLEDMRYPIPTKSDIPNYESGMEGGRSSLYLEEIRSRLPTLYGC
jgi:hypothetical protein